MKKRIVWLIAAIAAIGLCAPAKTVITSPTGLPDESDVALESAVNAVKTLPAETSEAVGGAISYTADELRNTVCGIKSAFAGESANETISKQMLSEVSGAWGLSDEVVLCSYKVTPALVGEMAPGTHLSGEVINVSSFFEGVDFAADTGAYLWPESGRLMVRSTRANLLKVENALSQYHRAESDYKQVEIKAKFIEVSQSKIDQLGFNWRIQDEPGADGVHLLDSWKVNDNQDVLGGALRTASGAFGSGPGAGSMVMTKTGWMPLKVAINALEQAGDSDVLSAPSLTTMDGKPAEIWVGEDRNVPSKFDVRSADVNIHIQHDGWKSEVMGVYFSVTPKLQKGGLIRLSLNPKIVDLIGYDTYKVGPEANMLAVNAGALSSTFVQGNFPILNAPGYGISKAWDMMQSTLSSVYPLNPDPNNPATWNSTTTTPSTGYKDTNRKAEHDQFGIKLNAVNGQLPYFRVRQLKTNVVVADGSTVGLGGLIYDRLETYKDKIPVLGSIPLIGRLFRSEGERSIKRNLMIFVSANQVGKDGQLKSNVTSSN
jgi:general secretion pathway protein D